VQTLRPFHPALSLLLLFVFVVFGSLIGFYVGMFVSSPFYEGSFSELERHITEGSTLDSVWLPLMIVQGCTAVFGFIILPSLLMGRQGKSIFALVQKPINPMVVVIAVLILFAFMVVDSAIAMWNKNLDFPAWMDGFEKWARQWEDTQARMTTYLTEFKTFGSFIVGLIVIAVIPGIGEEVLFRGIVQNEFYRGTKNIHVAIWVSAFLFSAFHIQFFGFFPRLLLGALFGYLYHWSGSLWVPIIAHFVNNGLIVLALYLFQIGHIASINPNEEVAAPWGAIVVSAVILVLLLIYFKKLTDEMHLAANPDTNPSID
jgi:uncharacterized protein